VVLPRSCSTTYALSDFSLNPSVCLLERSNPLKSKKVKSKKQKGKKGEKKKEKMKIWRTPRGHRLYPSPTLL